MKKVSLVLLVLFFSFGLFSCDDTSVEEIVVTEEEEVVEGEVNESLNIFETIPSGIVFQNGETYSISELEGVYTVKVSGFEKDNINGYEYNVVPVDANSINIDSDVEFKDGKLVRYSGNDLSYEGDDIILSKETTTSVSVTKHTVENGNISKTVSTTEITSSGAVYEFAWEMKYIDTKNLFNFALAKLSGFGFDRICGLVNQDLISSVKFERKADGEVVESYTTKYTYQLDEDGRVIKMSGMVDEETVLDIALEY